jgi:AraC-like DNA-binding protein
MEKLLYFPQWENRTLPLVILPRRSQDPVILHAHDFEELVIIEHGNGTHLTEEDNYPIVAGDVFVIKKGRKHGYRDTADLGLVNILFKIDELPLPARELAQVPGYHALFHLEPEFRSTHRFDSRLRLAPNELAIAQGLVWKIRQELSDGVPGYAFMATALFMELVGYLSRCYARIRRKIYIPIQRLGGVISHLESHHTQKIDIAALCRIACMSRSVLFRNFAQATGLTPVDYLIRLRIKHAARYLEENGLSVKEAAAMAGFPDSNYFSRQYRKHMGETPREARRRGLRPPPVR